MSSPRSAAIARTTARIIVKDPGSTIVMVAMPLVFIAFLKPTLEAQLAAQGLEGVSGARLGVPGLAVMFAFFSMQTVCMIFFREHYWGTWQRLRAAGATGLELVVGKAGPLVAVNFAQSAVVFGASAWLFGYRINGSLVALVALMLGVAVSVVALAVLMVAVSRSLDQAMIGGSMLGMVMSGLGGALAPASTLPGWALAAAKLMPTYWAIEGMRDVTLYGAGLADVLPALGVLALFSAACVTIAALTFRPTDTKVGTT